ncbi:CBS domain-containing protein [Algoriphagus kandeliae]|uniref:CBS domain-containing protein n=1 Tax=Algoriphagus kandeliae TaxID=2562278 RepID=A0A4Y9QNH1_9BACT|nr:CBS domain-containing protein [Algoriphagus kandeliae]TFV93152.1 CBS domain-containing protein [Algoriphagus kandeliae]
MGDHIVSLDANVQARNLFISHLLEDLQALDYLVQNKLLEKGIIRIGAEQEFCLINDHGRPTNQASEILEQIQDSHFTTELAKYNLEINLDPILFEGDCFEKMESQLKQLIQKAKDVSFKFGDRILLTGILPTISIDELSLSYMTENPRYFALNELMKKARGGNFRMNFTGVDELSIIHDSVMFEACNTSFQMHLQIDPDDFEASYNWAQAISGPVLAVAGNSPILMGKELWNETRIALFQQSIDTRKMSKAQTTKQARVSFGNSWVRGNIVDFFKRELSSFRILLTKEIEQNSMEEIKKGNIPKLKALNLQNGTIYRWNRPCYGVLHGKPHLRIENRYIPAGPTTVDEIANFAFWAGLMQGRPKEYDDLTSLMEFEEAKSNFIRAARYGNETCMSWMGKRVPANQLILEVFIPIAEEGLKKMGISPKSISNYLAIIKGRIQKQTGSQWMIKNYRILKKEHKVDDALLALTQLIYNNQQEEKPIHDWPDVNDLHEFETKANKVGHIMTTTLITADSEDSARLTLEFMQWNNIHHLPVVDNRERLVGLITYRHLQKYWDQIQNPSSQLQAKDIMVKEVIYTHPSNTIHHAIEQLKQHNIGCLPVVHNTHLVGIITLKDLENFQSA